MGWWSSVDCDSFRDETYGDVKTSGTNVQGRNLRGHNVWGRLVPVPPRTCPQLGYLVDYFAFREFSYRILVFGLQVLKFNSTPEMTNPLPCHGAKCSRGQSHQGWRQVTVTKSNQEIYCPAPDTRTHDCLCQICVPGPCGRCRSYKCKFALDQVNQLRYEALAR
jgi:hypothetical protein